MITRLFTIKYVPDKKSLGVSTSWWVRATIDLEVLSSGASKDYKSFKERVLEYGLLHLVSKQDDCKD